MAARFFLNCFFFEKGINMIFRNVGSQLTTDAS